MGRNRVLFTMLNLRPFRELVLYDRLYILVRRDFVKVPLHRFIVNTVEVVFPICLLCAFIASYLFIVDLPINFLVFFPISVPLA